MMSGGVERQPGNGTCCVVERFEQRQVMTLTQSSNMAAEAGLSSATLTCRLLLLLLVLRLWLCWR